MVYRIEAVILMEIGEPAFRITNLNLNQNEGNPITEHDLIKQRREVASIRDATLKRKIVTRYNKKIIPYAFEEGDLVLWKASVGGKK